MRLMPACVLMPSRRSSKNRHEQSPSEIAEKNIGPLGHTHRHTHKPIYVYVGHPSRSRASCHVDSDLMAAGNADSDENVG